MTFPLLPCVQPVHLRKSLEDPYLVHDMTNPLQRSLNSLELFMLWLLKIESVGAHLFCCAAPPTEHGK